jgi:hypothetical protein
MPGFVRAGVESPPPLCAEPAHVTVLAPRRDAAAAVTAAVAAQQQQQRAGGGGLIDRLVRRAEQRKLGVAG